MGPEPFCLTVFSRGEAAEMKMRAQLLMGLEHWLEKSGRYTAHQPIAFKDIQERPQRRRNRRKIATVNRTRAAALSPTRAGVRADRRSAHTLHTGLAC